MEPYEISRIVIVIFVFQHFLDRLYTSVSKTAQDLYLSIVLSSK